MSEDELELHHHRYEVEPFFATHAEKKEWKMQKKEEKALREERKRVLKHEREAREIEQAYRRIMDPDYDGDQDVDHYIAEHRWLDTPHETPAEHHEEKGHDEEVCLGQDHCFD